MIAASVGDAEKIATLVPEVGVERADWMGRCHRMVGGKKSGEAGSDTHSGLSPSWLV